MNKIITIIGICMLVMLTGCTKYYNSSNEVFNLKFSGDLKDLEFCNVNFIGTDGYGKGSFSFIGVLGDTYLECKNIKQFCDSYDNCRWRIDLMAESESNSNKWKPSWRGNCDCFDK